MRPFKQKPMREMTVNVKSSRPIKRIALLATGTEITQGEILNTDAQKVASILTDLGMVIGEHLVVDDNEEHLIKGFNMLFLQHDALISFGGLGPTSDDRTRFVIAKMLGEPLVLDDLSWQRIVDRFGQYNIPLTENNKQQSYFPKNATIFKNKRGSADGFCVAHQGKYIFALPGPPIECLPMFHDHVIDMLTDNNFTTGKTVKRWRLSGISESAIAERAETIAEKYGLTMGYRASVPYIDVKVLLSASKEDKQAADEIESLVSPYLLSHDHALQSDKLKAWVVDNHRKLILCDRATKGHLSAKLLTPKTLPFIDFVDKMPADVENGYLIEGLKAYWDRQDALDTEIVVTKNQPDAESLRRRLFIRANTIEVAVEMACILLMHHERLLRKK